MAVTPIDPFAEENVRDPSDKLSPTRGILVVQRRMAAGGFSSSTQNATFAAFTLSPNSSTRPQHSTVRTREPTNPGYHN
ncbi:hypothetical protein MPTK1_7g14630 [Marchantia polymorpha subsp. ruderalis]|uniref:Uncharacterized protein n=2 Tax=Marchantia polymorpha TaxID=3197 RepID=A0AAF6BZL9_MARPO|nr:hypothetical protein MARPO_0009s0148 [Marchantia polymorpha]BBN17453.1 hypothetical protein Mp_7g14630 [Marchantia polymorpha subsp. ruderalis]|eukprot:PTQ47058.1 hypothetical protein MARPO_0009s0148 [Marchantia polymorpha]